MKILHYECRSGISGDMNLAALIHAGVPQQHVQSQLALLPLTGYELTVKSAQKNGITGMQVHVHVQGAQESAHVNTDASSLDQDSHHHHNEDAHNHDHPAAVSHQQHHRQPQRNLSQIQTLIESSGVSDFVKKTSIAIFHALAEAEARVHATTIDAIHFHEVGAVDSIVDIVGAAICLDYLKPEKILCSPVELGGGFVNCQHGKLPVPAPATVELARDIPTTRGAVACETATPTAMAILRTIVNEFSDTAAFTIESCGYGIGHRTMAIPNLLRVSIGSAQPQQTQSSGAGMHRDEAVLIECNIDDMNPEIFEYIMERLFDLGADDVFYTPIIMKKSRPATQLSVLCAPQKSAALSTLLMTETSTLGIRTSIVNKLMLQRSLKTVTTSFGPVTIKAGLLNGVTVKYKPEFSECKALAQKHHVPIQKILTEALQQWERQHGE
ncbi:MAG: nickel pincer cofactor biosynthesis protein LarC [Chitinivibrionales bacterium]|nr:nickel pincer cofactor biosynthesis protein LarC [Chitinivibrionales bacterium]